MTEYSFELITEENINEIKYVKITGHWQLSEEIDEFEMYATFRGTEYDYQSLADTAINIYFGGAGQTVEIIDSETVGIHADQIPSWATDVFNNISYFNKKDSVVVYEMSQVEPSGRRTNTSMETGEKYSAGVRKGARRYSDFESGDFGFA